MSKHTPGPWSVDPSEFCGARINGPHGLSVAHATQRDTFPSNSPGSISQSEAEANGRLISAAPELLEALRDTLALLEAYCGESEGCTRKQARAAIAKATGEQS